MHLEAYSTALPVAVRPGASSSGSLTVSWPMQQTGSATACALRMPRRSRARYYVWVISRSKGHDRGHCHGAGRLRARTALPILRSASVLAIGHSHSRPHHSLYRRELHSRRCSLRGWVMPPVWMGYGLPTLPWAGGGRTGRDTRMGGIGAGRLGGRGRRQKFALSRSCTERRIGWSWGGLQARPSPSARAQPLRPDCRFAANLRPG